MSNYLDKHKKLLEHIIIFTMTHLDEIINLQPKGSKAKSYQVKQVREIILRNGLRLEE